MLRDVLFILLGYISGSILYAKIFGNLFSGTDITKGAEDENPGTANAYKNGGFACGTATLVCDILKGAIPVFLYCRGEATPLLMLIIAAPVFGHAFSVFNSFRGGKGIATTFGSLLGLAPQLAAVLVLAFWFVFFSVVICINPHYHRTFVTYICTDLTLLILYGITYVWLGFSFIFVAVSTRLLKSQEQKERIEVKAIWTR